APHTPHVAAIRRLALALFSHRSGPHRDLHSFPTRRSSDLLVGLPPPLRIFRGVTQRTGHCNHLVKVSADRRRSLAFLPALRLERSEEHTSELQSLTNLVCRLLLEKKKIPTPARLLQQYTTT